MPWSLKSRYLESIVPMLIEGFKYNNIHQVPKVVKIVVNCKIGEAASRNAKGVAAAMHDLELITGQKPVKTMAKKPIASFKGGREVLQPLGVSVTLRGNVMYSFLDRLANLGLPETWDFQGVMGKSFDGHRNYNLGLPDQSVFPELTLDVVDKTRGMDICIATTATSDPEAHKLLALMGIPFKEGGGGGGGGVLRKKKL